MTQEISSMMDGELDTHASERAIQACATPEGRQAWDTYHAIGDAMRGNAYRSFDISERVMRALDKEPTVLAPRAIQARPRPAHSFGRVALAAAASVVTIGVVGWIGTQGMPGASTPTVATGVTMQTNLPVGLVKHEPAARPEAEAGFAAIEVHDYLAAHRQVPSADQYRPVVSRTTPAPKR